MPARACFQRTFVPTVPPRRRKVEAVNGSPAAGGSTAAGTKSSDVKFKDLLTQVQHPAAMLLCVEANDEALKRKLLGQRHVGICVSVCLSQLLT
jgi:hypothetical protein